MCRGRRCLRYSDYPKDGLGRSLQYAALSKAQVWCGTFASLHSAIGSKGQSSNRWILFTSSVSKISLVSI